MSRSMGGTTMAILLPRQLPSLDVLTLMRGGLPAISPYQFPVVRPEYDESSTLYTHDDDDFSLHPSVILL